MTGETNRPPPVPEPIPELNQSRLWTSILFPPISVVIGALISSGMSWTQNNPTPLFVTLLIGLGAIMAMAVIFHETVSVRYRKGSLVFLNLAFLMGQSIACLFIWFGACLIIAS